MDLEAGLNHYVGGYQVAGAAVALVDVTGNEVVTINILPVPVIGQIIDI